ncbi:MAG TPA: efflux RND transporter periplasmic adaptor subunit [Candidatus Binatia bacterium]|nr:efflux RND transporter periplasmic adaptor subunit [Candidatus Binatia bacterium]
MSRSFREPEGTEPNPRVPAAPETQPPPAPAKAVVTVGRFRMNRWAAIAAGLVLLLVVVLIARGASKKNAAAAEIPFEPVSRRDISLTVEATGAVEPIDLIEVKSKASGQIVKMPVQVGSVVRKGDLLAQIDPRDVQNSYAQTLAALRAAQAKATISLAQKKRSDNLYAQAVITAPEHEAATLDYANAQAAVVKARTDLDLASQRREDATVRAPISGTVLAQTVANGTVISSATSSASGGTTLLQMADLSRIRIRALVAESDVGNVRPGQAATVTVDAFPNRSFQGTVDKVEPQAVVQQSVTMFPVLISISNEDGLLLPGMNGDVSMLIEQRQGVPAVPVDAVRSAREMPAVAALLGLKPEKVKEALDKQAAAMAAARRARFAAGGDSARGGNGGGGAGFRGGGGFGGGVGSDSARAAWRRARGGGGGGGGGWGGGGGRGSGQWGGRGRGGAGGDNGGGFGAGGGGNGGAGRNGGGAGTGGGLGRRAQAVFVKTANGIEPRIVRLGLSDFDYAQVIDGLKEGDQVALLSVAEAQAQREQSKSQIRQRMGSGVPGQIGGGGGRGAGGGGGGGRGGAGGGGGGR